MNDSPWAYYEPQLPGRDIFEGQLLSGMELFSTVNPNYHWSIVENGLVLDNYGHWAEAYNPAQNYPSTSNADDDNYMVCVLDGIQWRRTSHTPRAGTSPDSADPSGGTSGWQGWGYALGSVAGLSAAERPTKLPDDTNFTVGFFLSWTKFKTSRYPVVVHCATEAGVSLILHSGGAQVSKSNVVLGSGTFDLTFTADNIAYLMVDRSTPISSAFFLSGVPSYESGSPSIDIGAPYVSMDKLADFSPFISYRQMKGSGLERFAGGKTGTLTAANNTVGGATRLWKYMAGMAGTLSVLRINVPMIADDSYNDAMAAYFRDHTTCLIRLALDNEIPWNTGELQSIEIIAEAAGLGISAHQLYSRKLKAMILRWQAVFGAQASRIEGVVEGQLVSDVSTWQGILDFESLYTVVKHISGAPYWGGNNLSNIGNYTDATTAIRAAVSANDQTAFNAAVDTELTLGINTIVGYVKALRDWVLTYSAGKGVSIDYDSYEGGQSVEVIQSGWDSGLGGGMGARASAMFQVYRRSSNMGSRYAYYFGQMALNAPHLLYVFQYAEAQDSRYGWGSMDRMGNQTDEPYATIKAKALIYNV